MGRRTKLHLGCSLPQTRQRLRTARLYLQRPTPARFRHACAQKSRKYNQHKFRTTSGASDVKPRQFLASAKRTDLPATNTMLCSSRLLSSMRTGFYVYLSSLLRARRARPNPPLLLSKLSWLKVHAKEGMTGSIYINGNIAGNKPTKLLISNAWRRERDSNPRSPLRLSGFQDRLFQPLTHPSAS